MSEPDPEVVDHHPRWCDPAVCTADFAALAAGKWSGVPGAGEHRSAPLPLAVLPYPLPDGLYARLKQIVAPWTCSTFLEFDTPEGDLLYRAAWELKSAEQLLASLAALVAVGRVDEVEVAQQSNARLLTRIRAQKG